MYIEAAQTSRVRFDEVRYGCLSSSLSTTKTVKGLSAQLIQWNAVIAKNVGVPMNAGVEKVTNVETTLPQNNGSSI